MVHARVLALVSILGIALEVGSFGQATSPAFAMPSVTIQVGSKPALIFTEEDLMKMPQHTSNVKEHDAEIAYTGVYLHDLLVKAGAPAGGQLHGRALSSYVLATAKDGYQAVFTLTEMDPSFTDDQVLVADRANGTPLPETQGPFRLVAIHDKKPARSVRMLQKIDVVQLR